jgi:hypothetical protein
MNDRDSVIQQIQESLDIELSVAEEIYDSMHRNGVIVHEASGPRLPDDINLTAEYYKVFPLTTEEIMRDVAASWAGVEFRRIKE